MENIVKSHTERENSKLELDVPNKFIYLCVTYIKRGYYNYFKNRETYTSQHRIERCSRDERLSKQFNLFKISTWTNKRYGWD